MFLYTDRKSTRLNSSHLGISYAVFCLKKKPEKSEPGRFHRLRYCQFLAALHHQHLVPFFNDPATTEIYTLSLHDALPICQVTNGVPVRMAVLFLSVAGSRGER